MVIWSFTIVKSYPATQVASRWYNIYLVGTFFYLQVRLSDTSTLSTYEASRTNTDLGYIVGNQIDGDPATTDFMFEPDPRFRYPMARYVYVLRTDGASEMAVHEVEIINTEKRESNLEKSRIYLKQAALYYNCDAQPTSPR